MTTDTQSTPCRNCLAIARLQGNLDFARSANINELQELRAGPRVFAEGAHHPAGDHRNGALVNTAGRHALMDSIYDHTHAARLQHLVDTGRDLRRELLLHLEPPRVTVDHARELADSDYLVGRQIPNVHSPDDRRHVVLAMRLEGDVPEHDHLVIAAHFF